MASRAALASASASTAPPDGPARSRTPAAAAPTAATPMAPTAAIASATPRSTWDRITPELPRAPSSAPRASAAATAAAEPPSAGSSTVGGSATGSAPRSPGLPSLPPVRRSDSAAERMVSSRLVPVSPSGTGKTLIRSISARCRSRARVAARTQPVSSAASRVRGTSRGYRPGGVRRRRRRRYSGFLRPGRAPASA